MIVVVLQLIVIGRKMEKWKRGKSFHVRKIDLSLTSI